MYHNAPFCSRNVHVYTLLLQNGALWDICLMHCGICDMGLLSSANVNHGVNKSDLHNAMAAIVDPFTCVYQAGLSASMWYIQCISNRDIAVMHFATEMIMFSIETRFVPNKRPRITKYSNAHTKFKCLFHKNIICPLIYDTNPRPRHYTTINTVLIVALSETAFSI